MVSSSKKDKRKTWTSFVYVLEVSPNTLQAFTSKSPRRIDVSILGFTLACFLNFGEISRTRFKRTLLYVMSKSFCLCHRRDNRLVVIVVWLFRKGRNVCRFEGIAESILYRSAAFPLPLTAARQFVWAVLGWQRACCCKQVYCFKYKLQLKPFFLASLQVLVKAFGIGNTIHGYCGFRLMPLPQEFV